MKPHIEGQRGWVEGPPRPDFLIDDNGCWVWQRSRDRLGYGHARLNGRTMLAHRLAYIATRGPIPPGQHLHHTCRNPSCINPDHLVALTQTQHNRRYGAKLSEADVEAIRASEDTLDELAVRYAVTAGTIYMARAGLTHGPRADGKRNHLLGRKMKLAASDRRAIRASSESAAALARHYGVTPANVRAIWRGDIGGPLTVAETAAQAARQAKPNARRKLTDDDIRAIRASPLSGPKLAAWYGVTFGAIYAIKQGRTYRDVV